MLWLISISSISRSYRGRSHPRDNHADGGVIAAYRIKWLHPPPANGCSPPLLPRYDFVCWFDSCGRTPLWKQYGRHRRTRPRTWCCTIIPLSPAHLELFLHTSTSLDSTYLASSCLSPTSSPSGSFFPGFMCNLVVDS